MVTRRRFLTAGCGLVLPALVTRCARHGESTAEASNAAAIKARPSAATGKPPPAPGTRRLRLEGSPDALLHLPAGLTRTRPAPLVVTLHGAGGSAEGGLRLFQPFADEHGLVLLAPASEGPTWDGVRGRYGADVEMIDRALRAVFSTVAVDRARVCLAGFSDGASYALGLGLANGDLFRRLIAFSPGFVPPAGRVGTPAVFVSHGTADEVLPVEETSRRIVPALRRDGYRVAYREFAGRHAVPRRVSAAAVDWLRAARAPA